MQFLNNDLILSYEPIVKKTNLGQGDEFIKAIKLQTLSIIPEEYKKIKSLKDFQNLKLNLQNKEYYNLFKKITNKIKNYSSQETYNTILENLYKSFIGYEYNIVTKNDPSQTKEKSGLEIFAELSAKKFLAESSAEIFDTVMAKNLKISREIVNVLSNSEKYFALGIEERRYTDVPLCKAIGTYIREVTLKEGKYIKQVVKNDKTGSKTFYRMFSGFDTEYKDFVQELLDPKIKTKLDLDPKIKKKLEKFEGCDLKSLDDDDLATYYSLYGDKGLGADKEFNLLLSYQFSNMIDDNLFINTWIIPVDNKNHNTRFDLDDILIRVYRSFCDLFDTEGLFDVTICGHKNIVDISKFRDITDKRKNYNFISINNCFATPKRVGIKKRPIPTQRPVLQGYFSLRDSLLLYNPTSLRTLGWQMGFEKFELADNAISKMDLLLKNNFNEFYLYALRDAQISCYFCYYFYGEGKNGEYIFDVPMTIGESALQDCIKILCKHFNWSSTDYDVIFRGYLESKEYKKKNMLLNHLTKYEIGICGEHYFGGTNITNEYGFRRGLLNDVDIKSAYPTSASTLPFLDFHSTPISNGLTGRFEDLLHIIDMDKQQVGMLLVDWDYPEDYKGFPCIPVHTSKYGLYFPLSNKEITFDSMQNCWKRVAQFVSLQELKTAYASGCKIYVHKGFIFKELSEKDNPYRVYFSDKINERDNLKKLGLKGAEKKTKLQMNSVTGKTGQGLSQKRVYNFKTNTVQTVPISKGTNPPYVMSITATVRATINELMNLFQRRGFDVINVVTDGFVLDLKSVENLNLKDTDYTIIEGKCYVNDDVLNNWIFNDISQNPNLYPNLKIFINELKLRGVNKCVETKHYGDKIYSIKTRACIMFDDSYSEDYTHFTLVGYKDNKKEHEMSFKEKVPYFLDKIGHRKGLITNQSIQLQNSKTVKLKRNENSKIVNKKLDMNYDFKRQIDWSTVGYKDNYFSFKTINYNTMREAYTTKEKYVRFKEIQHLSIEDLKKVDLLETLNNITSFNFIYIYTINEIFSKLLCNLAITNVLYFNDTLINKMDLIKDLANFINRFELGNNVLTNRYFEKQKITDKQKEKLFENDNYLAVEKLLNDYYKTDKFKIKK